MTCRAIGVYAVLGMAIDAERHLDGKIRFGKRERHSGHVPVAREAGDFSDRHMSAVGKIGVIGHPVNLYPWDGLIFLDMVHQLFLLFALRHRLFVAAFANPDVRDRGFFMGKYPDVAGDAVQSRIFEMLFVIKQDGLGMIYAFRTTGNDECTEDREGYVVKGEILFHGSSGELWVFLSPGISWRARERKRRLK
jgi:hypothetical protein